MQVLAFIDLLAALACVVIAVISCFYRHSKAAKPFAIIFSLIGVWALLEGLMLYLSGPLDVVLWLIEHAVAVWIPLYWIVATRAITATPARPFSFWVTAGITLLMSLLCLTNPWHHLMFARITVSGPWQLPHHGDGPFFAQYVLFSYIVLMFGNFVLFRAWCNASGVRRTELFLWMATCLSTTLVDFLPSLIQTIPSDVRLTPAFFGFSASAMAWGYWRRISFRVQPVALEAAFQGLYDGILILDAAWQISQLNPAASTLLGHQAKEMVGQPLDKFLPNFSTAQSFGIPLERTFERTFEPVQNHSLEHPSNQNHSQNHAQKQQVLEFTLSKVQGGGFVVIMRDLTALRDYQNKLLEQARRDGLTGLYNRRAFLELAGLRLERSTLEGTPPRTPDTQCLIYFDLDRFKPINDTYGHETGDAALVEVADRLCTVLECPEGIHNPVIARVGGDEFVALIPRSPEACEEMMNQLERLLIQPMQLGEHTVCLGISWGMSVFPLEDLALEGLLRIADSKMYHRKRARVV